MWGASTILEGQRQPSILLFNYWSLRRQLAALFRKIALVPLGNAFRHGQARCTLPPIATAGKVDPGLCIERQLAA
jgi:hypothetical protein